MILVDSSVWIDHFRAGDDALAVLLSFGRVLTHPCVIGEIALGTLKDRRTILDLMGNLPTAVIADHQEVLGFIDDAHLFGLGIGFIDAHLLASVRLTASASLWTRDKRLNAAATSIGVKLTVPLALPR